MKISRLIAIIITLVVVGYLIHFFSDIVSYVLIAWVISMIGAPFMDLFLEKARFRHLKYGSILSAFLTLIIFILAVVTLFSVFVPLIVEQARNLSTIDYSALAQNLEEPLRRLSQTLYSWGLIDDINEPARQITESFNEWFGADELKNAFGSLVGFAGNAVISVFSILFITFFFLKEKGLFSNAMKALVPTEYEAKTVHAIDEMSYLLTRYFGGIVIQISIITILVFLGLSILGVEYALLIAFFAAVINVIPYVGPIIGATFAVAVTISSGLDLDFYNQTLPLLLKVVAVFAAMQMIDNFLLQPFIFSNSVKAHPLEIFIVILIGAKLGGILGMVLAIPGYTAFRVIAKVFLSEFKVVQKMTSRMK
ncbi:MAG: AI-2E family transporter [Saprospiraceae bacterium]|nr:AI-2E family transporter [Saprospiraceae bacterium]